MCYAPLMLRNHAMICQDSIGIKNSPVRIREEDGSFKLHSDSLFHKSPVG